MSEARAPFRAEHKRRRGRLRCRYTCGTCERRSGWRTPYEVMVWAIRHDDRCWHDSMVSEESDG